MENEINKIDVAVKPITVYTPESQIRYPIRLLRDMFRDLTGHFFGTNTMWYLPSHTACDRPFFILASFVFIRFRCSPNPFIRNGAFLLNTIA